MPSPRADKHQAFYHYLLPYKEHETAVELQVPGRFNLDNALAASAMALDAGVAPASVKAALEDFNGAEGRFTYEGELHGAKLYQDYAHTPDALAYTLDIARDLKPRRVVCFFQPITYSRAEAHEAGFIEALSKADLPLVLEVFDDREKTITTARAGSQKPLPNAANRAVTSPIPRVPMPCGRTFAEGDLALFIGQNVRQLPERLCAANGS